MSAIDSVFEWLLAATLRASVLAAVILCIQMVLRRWLPAGWRHALWLPMVAVLVLPVLPEAPFGLFPLKKETAMAPPAVETMAAGDPVEATAEVVAPAVKQGMKVNYLALVWFAGACGVLGAGLLGYRSNLARVRATATGPDKELAEDLEVAALQAGLGRAPQVLISPAVNSPAVTGFLRPVLLLPVGFPEGFDRAEARLILLHEFSHLKRLDLPLNWLTCVLQAMHWFNPLLWFAFARMRADREAACDARVLSLDAADNRSQYGGALLKLQCMAPTRAMSLGFVGIFERGSEVKARIRAISAHRPGHFAWQAAGGVILTALTLFGVTRAQDETELPVPEGVAGASAGEASSGAGEMDPNPGAVYILNKLQTLVIPMVDFKDVSVVEALDFLRLRAVQLDKVEPDPAKKGVNFVLRKPKQGPENYRKVTLQLQNVPLQKVLSEIAEQAGARYVVDDFAVSFLPKDDAGNDFVRMPSAGAAAAPDGQAGNKVPEVILAKAEFDDVPLIEAVQQLNALAKEAGKGEPVPRVVLDGSGDPAAKVRELRLRNVPLSIAVKYCAEQTNHRMVAREGELRLTREAAAAAREEKPAAKEVKPAGKALEAANKLVIPNLEFLSISLQEEVDSLNRQVKELSKGQPVFPIVIDPSVDATRVTKRELRMRNVPLGVALKYLADGAGLAWTANDREIRIVKKP